MWVEAFAGDEKQRNTTPVNILVGLRRRKFSCLGKQAFRSFFIGTQPGTNMVHNKN